MRRFIVTRETRCEAGWDGAQFGQMSDKGNAMKKGPDRGRRRLLGALGMVPASALLGGAGGATFADRSASRGRAVLISSTTVAGQRSLAHAADELKRLYAGVRRILLINFASLPPARDAYEVRMQGDFAYLYERFTVRSLHRATAREAVEWVEEAEAYFVSGGNTFLLLRELLDRGVMGSLRERVGSGIPYARSSAGSNLAGTVIGTTNDFPLVDIPSRRALGVLPGTYNPHHPDRAETEAHGSRQWKIGEYAAYHPGEAIFAVNNAGMIRVEGERLSLCGEGAEATVRLGRAVEELRGPGEGVLSVALESLRARAAAGEGVK